MTRLLVWRHGQTDWNAGRRVQGQSDTLLNGIGEAQARRAAPLLAAQRPDLIVSSDLRRAADTAAALADLTGLPIMLDERLRERDFGPWQGLTDTEIEAAYPAEFATWRLTGLADGLPIETPEQVGARALAALVDAATKAGDGTAVVVMHGAAARHAVGALLDWPAAVVRRLSSLDNCHFTDLRHSRLRGWQLHAHNIGAPTHDLGPAVPNADAMVGRSST